MGYDLNLPWGGHGSPCGILHLQRSRAAKHAVDPRSLPGVEVSFVELADCQECQLCAGCEVHEGCTTDWAHIEWHARFASPGVAACGDMGDVFGGRYLCALPADHKVTTHMARGGTGWPTN